MDFETEMATQSSQLEAAVSQYSVLNCDSRDAPRCLCSVSSNEDERDACRCAGDLFPIKKDLDMDVPVINSITHAVPQVVNVLVVMPRIDPTVHAVQKTVEVPPDPERVVELVMFSTRTNSAAKRRENSGRSASAVQRQGGPFCRSADDRC